MTVISGLQFDEKKNKTPKQVIDATKKYHPKIITEQYRSIISKPGSAYFSYVTPTNEPSKSITSAITSKSRFKDIDHIPAFVSGCDETAINTGVTSGTIQRLEESYFEYMLQ